MDKEDFLGSHNWYREKKQTVIKYGTTREKMPTVMNEGVDICFRAVMTHVFTVVGFLVELGTTIEKLKGSIEAYTSIR